MSRKGLAAGDHSHLHAIKLSVHVWLYLLHCGVKCALVQSLDWSLERRDCPAPLWPGTQVYYTEQVGVKQPRPRDAHSFPSELSPSTMPQWMSNTAIVIYNIHTFIIVLEKGEIYINFWLFRLLVSLYGLRLLPWNLTGKLCTQMNSRMLHVKASSEWKVSLIQWELYTSRKMGQKEMSEIANLSHWSISNITQIF